MADTATARKRLRKQSLGSNTNTWGDTKLNEVLDAIDQSMDGYLAIALTGDLTLTTTNYDTADQAKRRVHKFTGALSSPATVTYPSVEGWYFVTNAAGAQVTVKCSGGTGVAIPNNRAVLVYGDGTDLYAMVPNHLPTAITLTNNQDLVSYAQVQTLIANAALPATAGTLRNSAADTASDYLHGKLVATANGGLSLTTVNPGADEDLSAALDVPGMTVGSDVDAAADYVPVYDASVGAHRKVLASLIADEGQLALLAGVYGL